MNPTKHVCNSQKIDDYLEEQLNESEAAEFEKHLDACDSCRSELQNRSAEPGIWNEVVALLGKSESNGNLDSVGDEGASRRQRRALSVLDSLTPTDDPEMLGRVSDYEISGVVGVGGMGAVLKGFDKSLRRVVAIKVMAPHLANCGSARTRFQREARAAAAITHDNVINTYGVSEANGLPYLVMPFARGPSLQKRIDESGPMTPLEVVRIGRQIASGLAAAHEQGLVHRDIKPANILLNEGIERLWITDFGVARALDDASMTQTGVIAGTPQYMSPEQARGESVDPRSDLFSMGSVLYTACTGRPPFRSEAAYGILRRITDTDPPAIREINPEIPDWLCQIIARLMAKHPADRFQNAGEVAEVLEGCLAHLQQPTQVELPACIASRASAKPHTRRKAEAREQTVHPSRWITRSILIAVGLFILMGMGLAAWQMTKPVNIAGNWSGEQWDSVTLSKVEDATGWYTGSFTTTDGSRGAINLEWSRTQRRYNGRWKMSDEQTGSLTLRAKGDEIRGAVSIDSDSPAKEDTPRLREFSWTRIDSKAKKIDEAQNETNTTGPPTSIESPVKGRIIRWGENVKENANVTKGDVIIEIADIDPENVSRLEQQLTASKHQVNAAQILVQASKKNLMALRSNVATHKSQRDVYEQLKSQVVLAAKASVDSAKNKVDAAKAELAEQQAVLEQRQADLERGKTLLEQNLVSELKFQQMELKVKETTAIVKKAEALVQAAENDVIGKLNEEKTKEQKAQADIDHATTELNKVMGDVTKAESEVAKANLELQKAEKDVLELEVRVARNANQIITAPFAGVITDLTKNAVLKEGDRICLIVPEVRNDASELESDQSTSATSNPTGLAISGLTGASVSRMTETLNSVFAHGRRFRELNYQKRTQESGASKESVAKLEKEVASAEFERESAVAILKAQLDAAKQLNQSQARLRDMVKLQVENGDLDPFQVAPAEQAVVASGAEIGQLELLIAYYTQLGSDDVATLEKERKVATAVIQVRLEATKKKLNFRTQFRQLTRRAFELGHGQVPDILEAEQAEAKVIAEVKELEALLRYYERLGKPESDSDAEASSE